LRRRDAMNINELLKNYDLTGRTAVVTGGAGVLCAGMCQILASAGAKVAVLDIEKIAGQTLMEKIRSDGGKALALTCDVLERESTSSAAEKVLKEFGGVDILINGAGGNKPQATTKPELPFFDLPEDALRWVFELNLMGTLLPCQVFGRIMAEKKEGVILNVSSMNAFRPLTRIPAYSAAKAAINNFTQWLAVHMAQEYSSAIRVNAIAPGFFRTTQNEFLMIDQRNGGMTPRGTSILAHTPMARFGQPDDLLGTVLWLVSPASSFVTGVVIPVDGGFSAYSGV
jgi:NAD(P)-dependent dehydrogenase (short-subunit alcohol dehydrogenase family)